MDVVDGADLAADMAGHAFFRIDRRRQPIVAKAAKGAEIHDSGGQRARNFRVIPDLAANIVGTVVKDIVGLVEAVHIVVNMAARGDGAVGDHGQDQAVGQVEDASVPDETVAQVYQKGYRLGKKVIRPAMVTISTGGPKREVESDDAE